MPKSNFFWLFYWCTCPHAPHQNGIVERKDKHLVEITHTILLCANVLAHHLGWCYFYCMLPQIKCPLPLLNHIPYSILFLNEPLFHVSRICSTIVSFSSWHFKSNYFSRFLASVDSSWTIIPSFDHLSTQNTRLVQCYQVSPFFQVFHYHLPLPQLLRMKILADSALRKVTLFTWNPHPIYNFLNYHRLSSCLFYISKNVYETLNHLGWWQTMIVKVKDLDQNHGNLFLIRLERR